WAYGARGAGAGAALHHGRAADSPSADPGLVVIRRAGGAEGEHITNRPPERRATVLVDAEGLIVSESASGPGGRGAEPNFHHRHSDVFLVVEGEFTFHLGDGSRALPAGTLLF